MDLKETLKSSIARAKGEIAHCRDELEGKREISNLHRNSFHYIAGTNETYSDYFDNEDAEYRRLREVAKNIVEERARYYDSICRKCLDVGDLIEVFNRNADAGSSIAASNVRHLQNGGLIRGDHVLNYMAFLIRNNDPSYEFEAYSKITGEMFDSEFRRDSVLREIQVFQDYIYLCQKKGDGL